MLLLFGTLSFVIYSNHFSPLSLKVLTQLIPSSNFIQFFVSIVSGSITIHVFVPIRETSVFSLFKKELIVEE